MHAKSVLRLAPCDLKKLPIGALEAFVLSRVHADAVAEEVAEAAGLELGELLRVAAHLVELGALAVVGPERRTKRPTVAPSRRRATVHPAGKADSLVPIACVPKPRQAGDLRSLRIGPREGFVLSQIDGATSVADLGEITGLSAADLSAALRSLEGAGAVDLGRTRKRSTAMPKAPSTKRAPTSPPAATQKPPASAKRASTQKPPAPAKRALTQKPPAPAKRAPTQKPPAPAKRAPTQKPPAPAKRAPTQKPPAPRMPSLKPPQPEVRPRKTARPAAAADAPQAARSRQPIRELRLPQERVMVFVLAAEEALQRDDPVTAANHYRLAVQNSDDPALRAALASADARARKRVSDTSLAAARTAEQAGRWGEAATKYAKAYEAQPQASVAERAANAMRLACHDLGEATRLAEQAVLAEPLVAGHRVTLAEVYIEVGMLARAKDEAERAVQLAPADGRASALAKRLAKAKA